MAANEPSYKIDPVLEMAHVNGLLDDAACDEIADEHQRNGKSVRDIIVDGGYIAEDDLLGAMAAYNGSEVVALAGIDIPPAAICSAICSSLGGLPSGNPEAAIICCACCCP